MPGRTEVEQLQKIFELCGSPSEEFWNLSKLPYATLFKQQRRHKRCIAEIFNNSPPSLLPLIENLLAIDPAERQSATAALTREFFTTEPYACDLSNLPQYPPSKEMDAKPREANARSFVIGYMTSFFDLPVGSIFRILSLASPQDVCRVSVVSSAFHFAADSDCVWKGFLPSDHEEILSRASCAISFSSMKELYFRLCNSIPIDNSRKVFSLDRSTGKKCYMFCARELGISGLHDVKYWSWMSVPAFGSAQGVKAKEVWYLSIKCKINSNMLSPRTTYTALLVLRYEEDHIGLDVRPADVRVECGSQRLNGKALLYQNKELMELWTPVQIPIQRKDGWVEIELGDFFTGVGDEEVKMALEDKYTSTPKSRFVIIGIEVRPKKIS